MRGMPSKLAPSWGVGAEAMRRGIVPILVLVALILGVVNAAARSTATTTVMVEVIGKGTVKSTSTSGINCGNGNKKCFIAFGDVGPLTLKANAPSGWTFDDDWDGCDSTTTDTCTLDLSADEVVTATFTP